MNVQTISCTALPRPRWRPLACVCLAGLFIALSAVTTQSGWTSASTPSQSAASIAQQVKPGQVPDGPTANEWGTIQSAVQAAPLPRLLLAPANPVTSPTGNTHTAPTTTTVSITYDEAISPTTVSTRTFAVHAMQTGLLTQTYGVVSGTVMLTPTVPFKPGELVQVSATTGTLNLGGEGPISPTVWQFRVGVDGGSGVFAPHPTAPTFGGGNRWAVALGDVDDDGDLDAVDATGGPEHVYLNDGTGQFSPHPIGPTFGGWTNYDIDLGDVDGDGDLDAVVAGTSHAVYLNDGTGLFFPHPSAPTFGGGNWISLGDVDGDSDLDVMGGTFNGHYVYLNNGTGQFTFHPVSPSFGTDDNSTDSALGDIDGDGDLDAIVAQASGLPQKVYLNDGTGQLTPHPTAPTFGAGDSRAVALGDVDGDGDLDVVVGSLDSSLAMYLNNGIGQFSLHPITPVFGSNDCRNVILVDADGNGNLDVIASHGTAGISIYHNDGTGQFTLFSALPSSSTSTALGDVDRDGDIDIVAANRNTSPNETWLNRNAVDLSITKSVVPAGTLGRNDALTYTLTYSNAGAQIASGVVITDLVPITVTDVSLVSSGASVTPTGSISYTWQVQDLAPGTGGVITVYGRISPTATGLFTLTNQATITTTRSDMVDVDKDNNEAIVYSQVEAEPTIVTGVAPAPNTHAVAASTHLSATFSAPISNTTVTTQTFVVHGGFHGHLDGSFSFASVTFDPAEDLFPGELIQATASTGILDVSDNAPIAPYVWHFRAGVTGGSGTFSDSDQSLGSSYSLAVALGDLDGDGDMDAFVGNHGQANKVWLNDGTGALTETQSLGNSDSMGVALGDIDGDGDLDAFVGNINSQANKVWLNNGAGAFSDSGQSLGSSSSRAVAMGDLDGDGDLDAFIANNAAFGQPNEVWLNDGGDQGGTPGSFSDSGQSLGNAYSEAVALGDLDGDGDLDAFVGNQVSANKVYLNDGTGTFNDSGQNLSSTYCFGVALGDLDNDGDLDAFAGETTSSGNKVWLNDGAGTFNDSGQSLGSGHDVALGDLDGDSDLDVFIGNASVANEVWLNNGVGTFTDSHQSLGGSNSRAVALGDLDGDGDLDTFVANDGLATNKVWLNRNTVDLSIAKSVTPTSALDRNDAITYTLTYSNAGPGVAMGVVITDVIPATVTDVSFASSGASVTPTGSISYTWQVQDLAPGTGGVITVYGRISPMAAGLFTLTNQATITTTRSDMVDVDKDNNEAIVYSQVEAEPTIVTGVAPAPNTHAVAASTHLSATFSAPISNTTVTTQTFVVHGGFHGHLDGSFSFASVTFDPAEDLFPGELIQATASTGILDVSDNAPIAPYVWHFRAAVDGGSGEFNDSGQRLGNSISRAVALGDLDGDGDVDAFIANRPGLYGGGGDKVWLNDGVSTFTDSGQSLASSTSYAVALGDLDGDGDLDAFVGGTKVWLNDGAGSFTDNGQSLGTSYAVALGDLDGDGDLDALASSKVWLNDGAGSFTDSGQSLGSSGSQPIALGDLDKDGDLDALASYGVWLNDGCGTFTDSGQSLGSSGSHAVALGDLDGDGDLDVFVGNYYQANKVWLNDGTGTFSDSGQSLGSSWSGAVVLGDLDGDGDLDAFVGNSNQPNKVWVNDGTGTFSDSGQGLSNPFSSAVALGDLDGDGDLDVFLGNGQDTEAANEVWLNRDALTNSVYLPLVNRDYDPRLPYFDDFSDPDSGWYIGDSMGDVSFSYQDGEYEILLRNASWWWDGMLPPLGCVTNYSVEADMRRYSGNTTWYGLAFGLEDWDHLYIFIVDPGHQYYSVWRRTFPGDPFWVPLIDWTPSSHINPSDATNHLKVERSGNQITVYVNGQFLGTVNDSTYIGCLQVGLYAGIDSAYPDVPATVRYDNFQVRQLGTAAAANEIPPSHPENNGKKSWKRGDAY